MDYLKEWNFDTDLSIVRSISRSLFTPERTSWEVDSLIDPVVVFV